jgi:hypothetical protein
MHHDHFATLTRAVAGLPSRRSLLSGLTGLGLGLGAARLPDIATAKKRRHKKRKLKVKRNFFGCVEVGNPCANASDCCSGICDGKKGKKTCQVHGAGTCDQEADGYCQAEDPELTACNDVPGCLCWRTTSDSQFCGDLNGESGSSCAVCRKDADCEALGFPAGSACVPVGGGNCSPSPCGTACLVPCGTAAP